MDAEKVPFQLKSRLFRRKCNISMSIFSIMIRQSRQAFSKRFWRTIIKDIMKNRRIYATYVLAKVCPSTPYPWSGPISWNSPFIQLEKNHSKQIYFLLSLISRMHEDVLFYFYTILMYSTIILQFFRVSENFHPSRRMYCARICRPSFALVFAKTGSINSGTVHCVQSAYWVSELRAGRINPMSSDNPVGIICYLTSKEIYVFRLL